MSNKILIKRGLKASMPTLDIGELALSTDTNEIFIGTPIGNNLVNSSGKHDIVLIPDAAFTITKSHFNKTLIITSSSDVTITVPTQIIENIERGFFCDIVRYGTGEVVFSGAGIVLNSAGPLSIDGQYIAASLIKIDNNNEWLLIGGRE